MIRLCEPRRTRPENIVPMINVAFLLLIFFLMTAVIAPSDPVRIAPPTGLGDESDAGELILYIDADGTLWKDGKPGASLQGIGGQSVTIRADQNLSGAVLADVFGQLKRAGIEGVNLVVARP
jgi:biopolymer transport protein ExbD